MIRALLGLVAGVVFLFSLVLMLLDLALTPNPGDDTALAGLKSIDVVGWIAIGIWLLIDWWHLRLRVIAPPVAAWVWTYLLAMSMSGLGTLNWGP